MVAGSGRPDRNETCVSQNKESENGAHVGDDLSMKYSIAYA